MSRAAAHRAPARLDASGVPGAKPAPFPGFVEPCHRRCARTRRQASAWVHEIKFDGYRTQAQLRNGTPAVYTRAGHEWTLRFQPIADALAALPAKDLILDGEAPGGSRASQDAEARLGGQGWLHRRYVQRSWLRRSSGTYRKPMWLELPEEGFPPPRSPCEPGMLFAEPGKPHADL
jgi:hypothetical protein